MTSTLVAALLVGCNDDVRRTAMASAPRERSEVVQATGAPAASPLASAPAPRASAPRTRRLCEADLAKAPRDVPKKPLSRKAALGARPLPATLAVGRWTWINLFAAWCAPCKEELPRLMSFATRLKQAGRPLDLVLVSVDDDERELERFLAEQPEGARATYWLREGRERDEWLVAAGVAKEPALPVQVLVDPRGKVRCVVNGAVEEADFSEFAGMVAAP